MILDNNYCKLQNHKISEIEDLYYLLALENFFIDYKIKGYKSILSSNSSKEVFDFYLKKFSFLSDYLEISKINMERIIENKIGIIKTDKIQKMNSNIKDTPIILYFLGNVDILSFKLMAIAGTRKPSINGINLAKKITNHCIKTGYKIVSGLASGIDTVVHNESLLTGTIAVLAHGILDCYPRENKKLKEEIIDNGGLVLSQFNVQEKPKPKNFLERNKTIVNLSEFLIIPQAREKSGSTFTARYAHKIGKKVYCSHINSDDFSGNKDLLETKIAKVLKF